MLLFIIAILVSGIFSYRKNKRISSAIGIFLLNLCGIARLLIDIYLITYYNFSVLIKYKWFIVTLNTSKLFFLRFYFNLCCLFTLISAVLLIYSLFPQKKKDFNINQLPGKEHFIKRLEEYNNTYREEPIYLETNKKKKRK